MPELPEVETIRRHLAPKVEGRHLQEVEVDDPRWSAPDDPDALAAELSGRPIEQLDRRGKYLLWRLDGGDVLAQHLRMTGTVLYDPQDDPGHVRVRLPLSDGHLLVVNDPRRFGTGHLLRGLDAEAAYLDARLGPEPFDAAFTPAYLRSVLRGSRAPIKAAILDQKRVAGVGNIYADEALFRAKVHPLREAGKLTTGQVEALRDAIVETLADGIGARGSSIDDFRDPGGVEGTFQDAFRVHLREGQPCPVCANPVKKLVVGGRGTYVCETCQTRPRARRRAVG